VDVVVLAVRARSLAADGATYADAVGMLLPLVAKVGARLGVVGGAGSLRIPGQAMLHMVRPRYQEADVPESRNLPEARAQAELLACGCQQL
jgi:putative NADH-flavin reductase